MDFFRILTREIEKGPKKGQIEVYPDFIVRRSKDLMVRGHAFHAIWDEDNQLWSTDEYAVVTLVDESLDRFAEEQRSHGVNCAVKYLSSFKTNGWNSFKRYLANVSDCSHELDNSLTFANTAVTKTSYASKRLPYNLEPGSHNAWDELVDVLYSPEERAKIEWAIGSVVSGDSKLLQKFLVFYGKGGTGKSTIMDIIHKLFQGYTTTFEAKALVGTNNQFATEAFKSNPLVAFQHDGDLSRMEDNSKLNSIISHEEMVFNEKYKPTYTSKCKAMLFMGTNKPVKISDAKSGIIRRLIDVKPTGNKIPPTRYHELISLIDFELGAIAHHCLGVYRTMGKNYYNTYKPLEMMYLTDTFFNFVEANYDIFTTQNGTSLSQAYALYKEFVSEYGVDWTLPKHKFREELKAYFQDFHERIVVGGESKRNYYQGFTAKPYKELVDEVETASLTLDDTVSLLDDYLKDQPAQYANDEGIPTHRWANVTTTLEDLDTSKLHYVKVPENHIVIDFDLKEDDGTTKSLERNIRAASLWPVTYAEYSKSGKGIHLHYIYTGDNSDQLNSNYAPGIELKVFRGGASLRRMSRGCNKIPIATISGGLPLKEKKTVIEVETMQSERGLRDLIARNLRKEIHPGTKPSIDFIHKILEDAHSSGMPYDVTDLRSKIIAFANNSTNQPLPSLKIVQTMKFKSEETAKPVGQINDDRLVFFDVEVFPNLLVVCWKFEGSPDVVRMINPTPAQIESLFRLKLVGFNNRRYDNHILYGRFIGYDNEMLYKLSQRIVVQSDQKAMFGEAYGLSYTDIYDFSSKKQSLKKFEIELGILHVELNFPWDQPVPEEDWGTVVEYCVNDVNATEAVFHSRRSDFDGRKILSALSGLSVNDTTQQHTARIIFGEDKNPQRSFVYTDLSKEFDGYTYSHGVSTYRGETVGEGGYVYAEPGMYENVALLDVASMHPTSIKILDLFGEYTSNFVELVEARLAIKHKNYALAKTLLRGRLAEFVGDDESAKALAYALKIIINIVYGLTSAKFDSKFRDPRNKDNIVAKRGALFMIDLKHAVQEQGFTVAHIKTDSIKIPNATPEIIQFVTDFGTNYGYTFEHEDTYDKFCLVNDAVYVARSGDQWHAVGAQFQHPYVFKRLFNDGDIVFDDLCEAKSVSQGALYLDFFNTPKEGIDEETISKWKFVGRTGLFTPVTDFHGGTLYRVKDNKAYAASGSKWRKWIESSSAKEHGMEIVDMGYFDQLVEEAIAAINKFGDFEEFVS